MQKEERKQRPLFPLIAFFWLVFIGRLAFGAGDPAAQADALYARRSDAEADRQAVALYDKAIAAAPQNVDLLWKASRVAWWAGTRVSGRAEKVRFFAKGIAYGKKSVRASPAIAQSHFWLGSNYASYAGAKGAFTSLGLLKTIRREMAETNKIDESYLYGGADRVLGILDYLIPAFAGGDRDRAIVLLRKALTYGPDHPVTRFYIADYYAKGKNYVEARRELEALDRLTVSPELAPEWELIAPERAALAKRLAESRSQ